MAIDLITASGYTVDYNQIEKTNVQLADIYTHIFNMRRYIGAINVILAEHLLFCSKLTEWYINFSPNKLDTRTNIQPAYAITHDFHEYIVSDLPTGLKPYLKGYKELEEKAEEHVHNSIGLPLKYRDDELIKFIDRLALITEMTVYGHPGAELVTEQFNTKYDRPTDTQIATTVEAEKILSEILKTRRGPPSMFKYDTTVHFNKVIRKAVLNVKNLEENNG